MGTNKNEMARSWAIGILEAEIGLWERRLVATTMSSPQAGESPLYWGFTCPGRAASNEAPLSWEEQDALERVLPTRAAKAVLERNSVAYRAVCTEAVAILEVAVARTRDMSPGPHYHPDVRGWYAKNCPHMYAAVFG